MRAAREHAMARRIFENRGGQDVGAEIRIAHQRGRHPHRLLAENHARSLDGVAADVQQTAAAVLGLVPIIGWPAVLGQTLGVFIANQPALGDPLGPIDLINVIPSFLFSFLLWKLRNKSVFLGLTLYSVALGITVSYALNYAFKLPLLVEIPQVTVGVFIATAVFGYLLFRSAKQLGVLQRMFPN